MTDEREQVQGFGQRAPSEPAPAVTPADKSAVKRSETVSFGLMATTGVAVLGLNILALPDHENVQVYADVAACVVEAMRTADDCRSAYTIALAAYPHTAPHYDDIRRCESHHGSGHCLTDAGADASRQFVPRMAGYLLARYASQDVQPQPVYEHDDGGRPGYCTGSGHRITKGSGVMASSGEVKSAAVSKTKFGGFGSSGRGFFGSGG